MGLPAEQVFKTLVARGDRTGVLMAVAFCLTIYVTAVFFKGCPLRCAC